MTSIAGNDINGVGPPRTDGVTSLPGTADLVAFRSRFEDVSSFPGEEDVNASPLETEVVDASLPGSEKNPIRFHVLDTFLCMHLTALTSSTRYIKNDVVDFISLRRKLVGTIMTFNLGRSVKPVLNWANSSSPSSIP